MPGRCAVARPKKHPPLMILSYRTDPARTLYSRRLLLIWTTFLILSSHNLNGQGVCDRTSQVRDALVNAVSGVSVCNRITAAHLAGIEELYLWNRNPSRAGITELQANDFRGLSSLRVLRLDDNSLATLPARIFSGLSALEELSLHGNSLSTLPDSVFRGLSALEELRLNENSLRELPEPIFDGLSSLRWLGLEDNSLNGLPQKVFSGLESLTNLNLRSNQLSALHDKIFAGLASLQTLDLSSNHLNSLSRDIFSGLASLTSLELSGNNLKTLPEGIFRGLRDMGRLGLQNNSINKLPKEIFNGLDSLGDLDLLHNDLLSLPPGIFDDVLDTLGHHDDFSQSTLRVDHELTGYMRFSLRLPAQTVVEGATVRATVSLSRPLPVTVRLPYTLTGTVASNEYTDLSPEPETGLIFLAGETSKEIVFRLLTDSDSEMDVIRLTLSRRSALLKSDGTGEEAPYLQHFTLVGTAEPDYGGVHPVTVLDADNVSDQRGICNRTPVVINLLIREIDLPEITDCADVTPAHLANRVAFLNPSGRVLSGLQSHDLSGLVNLGDLWLIFTYLSTLPEGVFQGLGNLRDLELRENFLFALPEGLFRGLSRLYSLNLAENYLANLPKGIFADTRSLGVLSLRHNSLDGLPEEVFSGLTSLRSLILHSNSLTKLPEGIFSELERLDELDLSHNHLNTLPEQIFSDLDKLRRLDLGYNSLDALPAGVFSGLDLLEYLYLSGNSLQELPKGIFDDVLDTLWSLEVGSELKATVSFASKAQSTSEKNTVKVAVTLSRALPLAVRVAYTVDGSATGSDYANLSPPPEKGLLFLAGETRKEISFTVLENTDNHDRTIRLTLGPLGDFPKIYLRRSDGSGPDVLRVVAATFINRPDDGAIHTVTIVDFDPSTIASAELAGKQLALERIGSDSVKVVFGKANRFEEVMPSEDGTISIRTGSYAYSNTSPFRGTLTLAYDDGETCQVQLTFTSTDGGSSNGGCNTGSWHFRLTREGSLSFIPVILSAAGSKGSYYTSELTLVNRGRHEARLDYTYTAAQGGGSGTASEVLAPGQQKIAPNAHVHLRKLGIPIPESGNRLGTLEVDFATTSNVSVMARTTTAVPGGRAGLAYPGIAGDATFREAVYLCGLRQNEQDRSNIAFQNTGTPTDGPVTLRTTVFSGDPANPSVRVLPDITLGPGEFHQYSGVLGTIANGYAKVEWVNGTAPFYAYGVINDQANSDGSFVFPVTERSQEGTIGQTLPVIVETGSYTSELTLTNFSEMDKCIDFDAGNGRAYFLMCLAAGAQQIVPDIVDEVRQRGGLRKDKPGQPFQSAVFATPEDGDLQGIVIGVRTGSSGGGGKYSVYYNAVPFGTGFIDGAWVDGLQQNAENRSNLGLVNTAEVDSSDSVFAIEIYDGDTGLLVNTLTGLTVPPRGWRQINGILGQHAPGTTHGYVQIRKISGNNPFLAYGVINDGESPGQRSGDGAYIPARD